MMTATGLLAVGLSLLCGVGGSMGQAYARSLADIEKSKELRVCIVPFPSLATVEPEDCREKCKFSGIVHDEAAAFAHSLGKGVKTKFTRVDWDEQFFNKEGKTVRDASYTPELLASGKCDLYPTNLTKNEWRLKKLEFVVLFPSRGMVVVSKPMKTQIRSVPDLGGKTAAVIKDTSWHTWLQEQNQTSYATNPVKLEMMDLENRFVALDSGAVDFTVVDANTAVWATRYLLKNAAVAFPVGPRDEIGWAFRKEDKDLQEAVRRFFEKQKSDDNSALNLLWRKDFGISLNKFIGLIGSTP